MPASDNLRGPSSDRPDSVIPQSANTELRPLTARVNEANHLEIGGVDMVSIAAEFGTPVYVMDEATISSAVQAFKLGLSEYPRFTILYAAKAFLCVAMCRLVEELGLGLDVVSEGELHTAIEADFPSELIFMHGNNKSLAELKTGLNYGQPTIIVDNLGELKELEGIANELGRSVSIMLRVTPGVEPDTHEHIKTGHDESKFGFPLQEVADAIQLIRSAKQSPLKLVGLHAHIGSQGTDLEPYLESAEIMTELYGNLLKAGADSLKYLDLGGGLGISYHRLEEKPCPAFIWAKSLGETVQRSCLKLNIEAPHLLIEPGRSIVGNAGITLYRAGHKKVLPSGLIFLSVDGGMADNPRPITYQAKYEAAVANRMESQRPKERISIAGRYCESGDIIIKDAHLDAGAGDLVAVFATGAYNYSMSSNYNRTARPACVLVKDGEAELIIERESLSNLIQQDRLPKRLMRKQ